MMFCSLCDPFQGHNRFLFSFPLPRLIAFTKAREPSLLYYLPITIFPNIICVNQTASSKVLTWSIDSISYDDNHNAKATRQVEVKF